MVRVRELLENVTLLQLDAPDKLNAMDQEMAASFAEELARLKAKPPRVLVLTGTGRAFSAGGDLKMLEEKRHLDFEDNRRLMLRFYRSFLGILELEIPLVAAVNGLAVGAGMCLAAACDLRLADPEARFSTPFLKLGLYPGLGASYFLPRVLGGYTADMLLTGRSLTAAEALSAGLVTRISEPGQVVELATEVARELLQASPTATRQVLAMLRGPREAWQTALQKEAHAQSTCYAHPEFAEGLAAAVERRPTRF